MWNSAAWRNDFAMFKSQMNVNPKASYNEELLKHQEFRCPCCDIVLKSKKALLLHLESPKHIAEKQEVMRKNKYTFRSNRK